jgi:hypothetical protein
MKSYLLTIAWILSFSIYSSAQLCTVRADNNSAFNWRQNPYYFYFTAGSAPMPIDNPFVSNSNVMNIGRFRDNVLKDYDPLDGWNLIQFDFGSSIPGKTIDIPWIVLYNKYESILRVFMWVPNAKTKNAGKIDIKFKGLLGQPYKESALLNHASAPSFAMDNFEKKKSIAAPNGTQSNGQFWMYADFPMAYDPCTCNHFTTLKITGSEINISELKFSAGGEEKTVVADNSGLPSNQGFNIDGFIKGVQGISNKGTTLGSSVGAAVGIINDVSKNFDKKTTVYSSSNVGSQTVKAEGVPVSTPGFRLPSWIKDAGSGVGLALGLIDFLIGGGKQEPSLAMTLANLKYRGTITDSSGLRGFELYTPGSKWRNDPDGGNTAKQPYYDNVLGVFALLNTPTVKFKRSNGTVTVPEHSRRIYQDKPNGGLLQSTSAYIDQLNLKVDGLEDIEYAVNPASGLQVTDIKASLIINTTGFVLGTQPEYTGFDPNYSLNTVSPEPSLRTGKASFAYKGYSGVNVFEEKTSSPFLSHKYIIQTPPMSLSCIKNYIAKIGYVSGQLGNTSDIRLQIMATLKRTDNPNAKEVMFINQYNVNLVEDNGLTQTTDLSLIPIVTTVENLTLNQDLTIRAWDSIAIKGNINTNGFKLRVISGGQINVIDQSVFNNPNIELLIGTPDQCSGFRQPVDAARLTTFCGSKYNPNSPASLIRNEQNGLKVLQNLNISPNPFSREFNINFILEEETKIKIDLFNSVGQNIKNITNEIRGVGNHLVVFEGSDLAPGIYLLTLRTQNGTETKKIVKQ